ncbi:hypothetical protein RB213_000386 [Colletotrichum asianum]
MHPAVWLSILGGHYSNRRESILNPVGNQDPVSNVRAHSLDLPFQHPMFCPHHMLPFRHSLSSACIPRESSDNKLVRGVNVLYLLEKRFLGLPVSWLFFLTFMPQNFSTVHGTFEPIAGEAVEPFGNTTH